jgi:hypothetical protein
VRVALHACACVSADNLQEHSWISAAKRTRKVNSHRSLEGLRLVSAEITRVVVFNIRRHTPGFPFNTRPPKPKTPYPVQAADTELRLTQQQQIHWNSVLHVAGPGMHVDISLLPMAHQ